QQEGWHFELDAPDNPLAFKGVVFNEMKGVYSSPDSLLAHYNQQALFPETPYRHDSGGDPTHIPNLTYAQFKQFHQTYYHPSNARLYFYGDDDPETRLRLTNAYLNEFERRPAKAVVPLQPPFKKPRRLSRTFAAGPNNGDNNQTMLTTSWLLPENNDMTLTMALNILSYILLGTPASPLRKALIESGLGEDLTGGGMADHLRQGYFSTGLKGIAPQDTGNVETLILQTLTTLAQEGIDPEMVEAAFNTVEFALREQNTGGFPRGLAWMLQSLTTWLYHGDPFAPLAFEAPLNAVKTAVAADSAFFQKLIRQHLLQNPHRLTLILTPDPEQRQREEAAEKERLARARAKMGPQAIEAAINDTRQLKQIQETPDPPEALAAIPHLKLTDLDPKTRQIPLEALSQNDSKILYHNLFTNGIVYLDVGFNTHLLPPELLPYLPLFSQALLEIGTETEDYVKLSQRIGRKTGGIWTSTYTSSVRGADESAAWLFLRGKATPEQTGDLLDILRDVLLTVKLDNPERFKQMVLEDKAGQEAGLIPGGHGVVNSRLRAHFNEADWAVEEMGGVSNLFFVRQLARQVEQDWPAVLEKLEAIRRILLNRRAMICNVTVDEDNWAAFRPRLNAFLAGMPAAPAAPARWTPSPLPPFEGLTIPAQVNFVAKGANLYRLGYSLHGSASVITHYLRTTWLWERVRVHGGAYGGSCSFDHHSGVFSFVSYRDPNLAGTLATYDKTAQFLRRLNLSQAELTKAIIGAIGRIDAYRFPDAKGYGSMLRHLIGYSDEDRQRIRDQILATTPADFNAFGEVLEAVNRQGQVVVMGSPEAVNAANAERGDWLNVVHVL
ncbi:MAG: insulinase family protein, partial [Anaerolineae bacterium]